MEFGYKAQINVLFLLLKSKVGAKRCELKQKVGAKRCEKHKKNTNQGVLIWLYNSSNSLLLI